MDFLIEEVMTELDAFDIYSVFKEDKTAIFLDSGMGAENLGRFSFIGLNPFSTIKYEDGVCNVNGREFKGEPFEELNRIIGRYRIENNTDLPYIGGAMGYFSYDLARTTEEIPVAAFEEVKIPDLYFYFYDNAVIVDNLKNKTYITSLGILKPKEESICGLKQKIAGGCKIKYEIPAGSSTEFKSNFTREEYIETVERVRQYIRSGDVYITNLTQRFCCETKRAI